MKLVNNLIYEFEGRQIVHEDREIVLVGSNLSAEGEEGDEGSDERAKFNINFVREFKLFPANEFKNPETFNTYIKGFMKKVIEHMQSNGKSEEEVNAFKTNIQEWVTSLRAEDRFKNLAFFIGENMAEGRGEGQVAIVEYRETDEGEVPMLMLIKEGLRVSTSKEETSKRGFVYKHFD